MAASRTRCGNPIVLPLQTHWLPLGAPLAYPPCTDALATAFLISPSLVVASSARVHGVRPALVTLIKLVCRYASPRTPDTGDAAHESATCGVCARRRLVLAP